MKHLEIAFVACALAVAMAVVSAGTASATTLEVEGVAKNSSVSLTATLKSGTSFVLKDTFGIGLNTCTGSEIKGSTASPFTGTTVTTAISTLSFKLCDRLITVHNGGTFHIQWTSGTNGTVSWSGAEVTTGSPFGTLNCQTGTGTHLGTLTGVKTGNATIDINAVIDCSGLSTRWEATYTVTSPTGPGVVS